MNLSTYQIPQKTEKATTTGLRKKENNYKDIDLLYETVIDLVNPSYKLWYCKQFNIIGKERVVVLASQARVDGKDSVKLFSYLIKKEVRK